jgi:hypothetical protein
MSTPTVARPVSLPVSQPQPNAAVFPVQYLRLFQTYTRASYRATFGLEPPAWDPARLTKSWFDSSADTSDPSNVAVYKLLGQDSSGNWTLQQMVIPSSEAATVNLTGQVFYPPYSVAPTNATRGGIVMNAAYMALQSDAQELMTAIGGTQLTDQAVDGDPANAWMPILYPPDESRRMWFFLYNGQMQYVGILLMSKNALGVGSPGQWVTSSGAPIWSPATPAPTGLEDTRSPRAMPMRNLLPNEQLQTGMMGPTVVRLDLEKAVTDASGQFTPDDRATLQQIYQLLSKIGS